MAETKGNQQASCCCCGSFAIRVQPMEKGVMICVQAEDADPAQMAKRVVVCCAPRQERTSCCEPAGGESTSVEKPD